MKAAEWIALIPNDKDRKFARAACMEVIEEASSQELMDELKRRRPKCGDCQHDGKQEGLLASPMPGMDDGCELNCGWQSFFADLFTPRKKK
jgi:hypothetical protein